MRRSAICATILSAVAFGQTTPPPPTFEVADVQVSKAGPATPTRARILPTGRIEIFNAPMKLMVIEAYSIKENLLTNAPAWFEKDRFDIVAKAKPDTPEPLLRVMLQNLLGERFHLRIERPDKLVPVYALIVGKKGHKLQPSAADGKPGCGPGEGPEGQIHRMCKNITMDLLAQQLPGMAPLWVDAPVINLTELKGAFDFPLDWSGRNSNEASTDQVGMSMFDALERLGLKLDSRKQPMASVEVVSCERTPTEQ
jgi:uncharacterized protein (TIGR03435 family)